MDSKLVARNPEVIVVGAGLSGAILAWYLKSQQPQLRVLLLEQNGEIHSNKTWCFHKSDLCAEDFEMIKPLLTKEWAGYDVAFQNFERTLNTHYCAIRPENLQTKLEQILGSDLLFNIKLRHVDAHSIEFDNGEKLAAPLVIDARGINPATALDSGYQKFFGQQLEFENAHGLTRPILMDTRVSQCSGFRFIYVLPWTSNTALIEDTYYDEKPDLDIQSCQQAIRDFATAKGWKIKKVVSEERGQLPIPLHAPAPNSQKILTVGVSAGFYHAVTGYSVPDAVRVASRMARILDAQKTASPRGFQGALTAYRTERDSSWTFLCVLNRMMFMAASREKRVRIFERFYHLPQKLIERFYAGNLTWFDKLRILSGKPPVPVLSAISAICSSADSAKKIAKRSTAVSAPLSTPISTPVSMPAPAAVSSRQTHLGITKSDKGYT